MNRTANYETTASGNLRIEYEFHAAEKATGESGLSLGTPNEGAYAEVIGITCGDDNVNILPWLESHGLDVASIEDEIIEHLTGVFEPDPDDQRDAKLDREPLDSSRDE